MITRTGYSDDPAEMAEGIAVTLGVELLRERGVRELLNQFLECMADDDNWWLHKMKNAPVQLVGTVYIIVMGRLWGSVNYGWRETGPCECVREDGTIEIIDWPRITLVGPFIRCPFKRKLKGFQGFRYTLKLF